MITFIVGMRAEDFIILVVSSEFMIMASLKIYFFHHSTWQGQCQKKIIHISL